MAETNFFLPTLVPYFEMGNQRWVLNRTNMVDAETISILNQEILPRRLCKCARVHYTYGREFFLRQMRNFFAIIDVNFATYIPQNIVADFVSQKSRVSLLWCKFAYENPLFGLFFDVRCACDKSRFH